VITTKTVKGNPEFSVQLSNWNTQPKLSEALCAFNRVARLNENAGRPDWSAPRGSNDLVRRRDWPT